MDYRYCPLEELRHEITRRGFVAYGGRDELSERLCNDDALRGTDATTIATTVAGECEQPRARRQIADYDGINPSLLVGECIIHWKLNTLFSTLQLFFESGLSCTIESRQLREAFVGIDQSLRFRLTDLTYEEGGVIVKSPLPKKVVGPYPSIHILEALVADRVSIATKPTAAVGIRHMASIEYEAHTVIGLKLEGMSEIGYVWSKVDQLSGDRNGVAWGSTSVGSLRDDVPAPLFNLFSRRTGKSSQQEAATKQSIMTHAQRWSDPALLLPVRDPEDHICELGQCFPDMA